MAKEINFEDNISQQRLQEMEDYFLTLVRKGIQEANKNTTTPPSVQEYSKAILLKLKIAGAIASAETKLVNESRKLPLFESLMQFEFVDRSGAKFTEKGIIPKARAEQSLTIVPLKNMIFVPISSSWIAEIGFDYTNHDLYIHYKKQSKQGNDLYKYEKVDEGEFVKILRSRGRDRYNAIMIIVKRYEDTVLRLGKRSQMKEVLVVPIADVPTVIPIVEVSKIIPKVEEISEKKIDLPKVTEVKTTSFKRGDNYTRRIAAITKLRLKEGYTDEKRLELVTKILKIYNEAYASLKNNIESDIELITNNYKETEKQDIELKKIIYTRLNNYNNQNQISDPQLIPSIRIALKAAGCDIVNDWYLEEIKNYKTWNKL